MPQKGAPPPQHSQREGYPFPIVGIGASAGGLEALEQFFRSTPADIGMAFVAILHLDPFHVSNMPPLLRRYTTMPVHEAADGMMVQPNSIYVIPPNKNMAIMNGALQLLEPPDMQVRGHAVDFFFRSLAQDRGDKAICIVLSGTGTDGTLGLRAVKAQFGMAMVQDPESAKYDGMPRSAADTGLADFILPVARMPETLISYIRQSYGKPAEVRRKGLEKGNELLKKVYLLLRTETGHDFSGYKEATISRRIERRMMVNQIEKLSDYVRFLQEHPEEVRGLFKDFLISVTSFFRDAEAFTALKKHLKLILSNKPEGTQIRAWVPGCASGEEAYSIAIIIRECTEELGRDFPAQVFGTDIDRDAIAVARGGEYPTSIAADVGPDRLKRFFGKKGPVFQVRKEIKEMMVFAIQDILKDPPFSRLDVISCRNLLIYLTSPVQRKVLPLLHYSLSEGGILFLGPSETVGDFTNLFSGLDRKWKVYQRKPSYGRAPRLELPTVIGLSRERLAARVAETAMAKQPTVEDIAKKVLEEAFIPPSVVIDQNYNIVYFHGRTGKYLEPPPGHPNWTILEMARGGLKTELATAVRRATREQKEIKREHVSVTFNGDAITVTLTVKPLSGPSGNPGYLLVSFQDEPSRLPTRSGKAGRRGAPKADARLGDLERDLRETRENLQTVIEELETSNEELKSTNEEYMSGNEELQSTNEELETSREELQSVNEELMTAVGELQNKNTQLEKVNDDINNLLDSTHVATIFVDTELRLQRFTPAAAEIFGLTDRDINRPIRHITSRLEYPDLASDATQVLDTLRAREVELQTADGHWYSMRILPYRTLENAVGGLVMAFVDIHERKLLSKQLAHTISYAEAVIQTLREPMLALDGDLRVILASRAFYETFRVEEKQTVGRLVYELGDQQWDIPELRKLLEDIRARDTVFEGFEVKHDFPGIGQRRMLLNARRLRTDEVGDPRILLAMEDVTDKRR